MSETATQEKKDTRKRVVHLDKTEPHPVNREFSTTSPEWVDFVQSIAERGVIMPPTLRLLGDSRYQIIFGHRRIHAAKSLGIEKLDCLVCHADDREALELLLIENLQRENPDPVEEAKLVAEMAKLKMTAEEIARRVSRSVEWVTTRQGMLDLGPEVMAAVKLPKEDERHLGIGVVQMMLQLDRKDWAQAVQMVLHPEFKLGALNVREAGDVLRTQLLEPRKKQQEWDKGADKLAKAWRKRLGGVLSKGEKKSLVVRVVGFDEEVKARRRAEDALADEPTADLQEIPAGALWLHLAVKHEQTILIVPAENEAGCEAVVNESLLKLAEQSAEEHGVVTWLSGRRRQGGGTMAERQEEEAGLKTSGPSGEEEADIPGFLRTDREETATGDRRHDGVQDALHVLEGQGERGYQEEEKKETVIEQRMESGAWVNLMPVRALREWGKRTPMDVWDGVFLGDKPPGMEGLPQWLLDLQIHPDDVVDLCDWFLSLNSNPGGGR